MDDHAQAYMQPDDEVTQLVGLMRQRKGEAAVTDCLRAAAALVEHAAYEMAQAQTANHVAQLILTASNLERIAQGVATR